jgi:hypothetical protein
MRVTIIPEDGFVSIDGKGHSDLDLSFLPASVHAVQWYGEDGEVEHVDERGRAVQNEEITDLTPYQGAIDAWQQAENLVQDVANTPPEGQEAV